MLINNNTKTLSTHTLSHVPITFPNATKQKEHNSKNERHRFQKALEIYNSNGKSIIPNIKTTATFINPSVVVFFFFLHKLPLELQKYSNSFHLK